MEDICSRNPCDLFVIFHLLRFEVSGIRCDVLASFVSGQVSDTTLLIFASALASTARLWTGGIPPGLGDKPGGFKIVGGEADDPSVGWGDANGFILNQAAVLALIRIKIVQS